MRTNQVPQLWISDGAELAKIWCRGVPENLDFYNGRKYQGTGEHEMKDGHQDLCALTCPTVSSPALMFSEGELSSALPFAPPLRDAISFEVDRPELKEQVSTLLQLVAGVQRIRFPWMNFDGLFRLIVAIDRDAAVRANAELLEGIGQSADAHLNNTSAFAFPCGKGVVVILPLDVVRYALAPENEVERQYGLTTIWHELTHVHDLTLLYYQDGVFMPNRSAGVRGHTRKTWHEFFADRHSHWQGFSVDLEMHLLKLAWQAVSSEPSAINFDYLLVRLASAYGRLSANGAGEILVTPQASNAFLSADLPALWRICQGELDDACTSIIEMGVAPSLTKLESSLDHFRAALLAGHL